MPVIKAKKLTQKEQEEFLNTMSKILEEQEYQRKHAVFWFKTTKAGNTKLIRPDGSYRFCKDKNPYMNERSNQGWQRSVLFMDEMKIWDATAFAASMDSYMLFQKKEEFKTDDAPEYILLTTPQFAESFLFAGKVMPASVFTSEDLIERSHWFTDLFYGDREAQLSMRDHILYGVAFEIMKNGDLLPLNLVEKKITDALLEHYEESWEEVTELLLQKPESLIEVIE